MSEEKPLLASPHSPEGTSVGISTEDSSLQEKTRTGDSRDDSYSSFPDPRITPINDVSYIVSMHITACIVQQICISVTSHASDLREHGS